MAVALLRRGGPRDASFSRRGWRPSSPAPGCPAGCVRWPASSPTAGRPAICTLRGPGWPTAEGGGGGGFRHRDGLRAARIRPLTGGDADRTALCSLGVRRGRAG